MKKSFVPDRITRSYSEISKPEILSIRTKERVKPQVLIVAH